MVPRPGPSDTHSSLPSSTTAGSADPTEDQGASQQSRPAPASHLVTVRESLLSSGASDRVFQLVSQPKRDSTENVYNYRWARWQDWCNEPSVACMNPSAPQLANFLTFLSDTHSLSASTVKGYHSAISTTIRQCGGPDLSNAHLLHDVARGLSLREARQPRRIPSWDLFVVLDALRRPPFEPLHSVSFKFLTMKTAFLLSLASGRRRSEIHALSGAKHDIAFLKDKSIQLKFLPEFLAKNQCPGDPSPLVLVRPLSAIFEQG